MDAQSRQLAGRLVYRRRFPAAVSVAGLVLAGGRGARIGGRDKGLVRFRGKILAARAAGLLAPVCDVVAVSANRHVSRYASWADLVTTDRHGGFLGPLAGIAAGLAAVRTRWLVTCPCDATGVPADVPGRLLRAARSHGGITVAVLRDEARLQPLLMAVRGNARPGIEAYLARGGRSVHGWLSTTSVVEVKIRGFIGNRNLA